MSRWTYRLIVVPHPGEDPIQFVQCCGLGSELVRRAFPRGAVLGFYGRTKRGVIRHIYNLDDLSKQALAEGVAKVRELFRREVWVEHRAVQGRLEV